jgi:hypothetical protein
MEVFIDITLSASLWPWGRLSLWRKWEPGIPPWGKGGRCVGLTTLPPSSAHCLKIWVPQPPGTLRPCQACNGIALPFTINRVSTKLQIIGEEYGWMLWRQRCRRENAHRIGCTVSVQVSYYPNRQIYLIYWDKDWRDAMKFDTSLLTVYGTSNFRVFFSCWEFSLRKMRNKNSDMTVPPR